MLQLKHISSVLAQGLRPLPHGAGAGGSSLGAGGSSLGATTRSPLALLLLLHSGLPLATVSAPQGSPLTPNNLKIYTLLAVAKLPLDEDWTPVELDHGLHALIERVLYHDGADAANGAEAADAAEAGADAADDALYVVLFYNGDFPAAVAKLKLDNVTAALASGLRGYRRVH
jgi:hypothetical protein